MSTDAAVTAPQEDRESMLTRGFMLSCAGILALLLGLGIVVINHFTQDDPSAPPAIASEQCDLPASDQTDLVGVPAHGWALVGKGEHAIAVPKSSDHGPARSDQGVPSCWAQSPMGAVSAAMTFAAMASAGEEYALAQHLTVSGPEREALLAETPEQTEPTAQVFIDAFRLVDYDQDSAEVTVVMAANELDGWVAATIEVAWVDGDWRYDPPSSLEPEFSFPTDLQGYTEIKDVDNG